MKTRHIVISLAACMALLIMLSALPQGAAAQQKASPSPSQAPSTPAVKVSPAATAAPPVQSAAKTIFDFEKELGLSPDQVKKLKDGVSTFNEEIKSLNDRQKSANKELAELINSNAALDKIKEKLQQVGAIELDIRMANVKLTRKVNETLTKDQSTKWKEIQKRERGGK